MCRCILTSCLCFQGSRVSLMTRLYRIHMPNESSRKYPLVLSSRRESRNGRLLLLTRLNPLGVSASSISLACPLTSICCKKTTARAEESERASRWLPFRSMRMRNLVTQPRVQVLGCRRCLSVAHPRRMSWVEAPSCMALLLGLTESQRRHGCYHPTAAHRSHISPTLGGRPDKRC
jgi:hypothetical protein